MAMENLVGCIKMIFEWRVSPIHNKMWILRSLASGKISSTEIGQEFGMNPPVASTLVKSDFTSLKTFMKRQIMADCILPSHSVFSKFRIGILYEAVDLRQSFLSLWRTEDGVGNGLNVRQRTRIPLALFLVWLCWVRNFVFLGAWYTRWLMETFPLIQFLCTFHDYLTLQTQLDQFKFHRTTTQYSCTLYFMCNK